MEFNKSQKGFTLFLAVIIAGMLLLVVVSISNIALKETILTGAGRESQIAFSAANSGVECALYWDLQEGSFINNGGTPQNISCGDKVEPNNFVSAFDPGTPSPGTTTISFKVTLGDQCTDVTIYKFFNENNRPRTIVESRGHNSCSIFGGRSFERAIRAKY